MSRLLTQDTLTSEELLDVIASWLKIIRTRVEIGVPEKIYRNNMAFSGDYKIIISTKFTSFSPRDVSDPRHGAIEVSILKRIVETLAQDQIQLVCEQNPATNASTLFVVIPAERIEQIA